MSDDIEQPAKPRILVLGTSDEAQALRQKLMEELVKQGKNEVVEICHTVRESDDGRFMDIDHLTSEEKQRIHLFGCGPSESAIALIDSMERMYASPFNFPGGYNWKMTKGKGNSLPWYHAQSGKRF